MNQNNRPKILKSNIICISGEKQVISALNFSTHFAKKTLQWLCSSDKTKIPSPTITQVGTHLFQKYYQPIIADASIKGNNYFFASLKYHLTNVSMN